MEYSVTRKKSIEQPYKFILVPVHGHRIVIEGFEDFSFFIHRPFPEDEFFGGFVISEKSTGSQVAQSYDLRDTIRLAISRLRNYGRKGLKLAIAKQLENDEQRTKSTRE